MEITNLEVFNIKGALRGMRNPKNSWDRSTPEADLELATKLYKAGTEHRKYARQIFVCMDIEAPLYWVAEHDTYKVNTVRDSCSFMHKGTTKEFEIFDFEVDDGRIYDYFRGYDVDDDDFLKSDIEEWEHKLHRLNKLRLNYLGTENYHYFRQLRQELPSGYISKYTWTCNYETVFNILKQRKNHPLKEWRIFCKKLLELPMVKEITGIKEEDIKIQPIGV